MRRVLFDEDVPRPLRRDLPGFDIQTVGEAGWSGVKNGELLRRANDVFDVFLTADRNLAFQQNLSKVQIAIVVLAIGSTKLQDLRAVADQIVTALHEIEPGELFHVRPTG